MHYRVTSGMSALMILCAGTFSMNVHLSAADRNESVFARTNLVAWCIVPFDAEKRGPADRARMLKRLGIQKVAYDWRQEHVREFEEEILEYRKNGLEYFAFWSWHPDMEPLIKKHDIHPQIWMMIPQPEGQNEAERVESAARKLLPTANKANGLGCALGLYNHGGWGGEPENMVAVCRRLRELTGSKQIGIVYNFHHGHEHVARFPDVLELMKPYLLCLNLNGMNPRAEPKILPIGDGKLERNMLMTVRSSGYTGPVGILDHRTELDAEKSLRLNLEGLQKVLREQNDSAALATFELTDNP